MRDKFKPLTYRKKWLAGRSTLTGRVVIRTKQSLLRRVKLLRINYNFRLLDPGFVSTLTLVPFSNKLLILAHFPSGASSYLPATISSKVFALLWFKRSRTSPKAFRGLEHHSTLRLAPMHKKVSNLELLPGKGMQYARSEGSFALITRVNSSNHTAMVKLPSGVRKIFSVYSILLLGPSALKLKRKLSNTKSGFWRSYGVKSQVRGVAMNPVDHPHGGRTKSIRYPRTPWGKTTKFK